MGPVRVEVVQPEEEWTAAGLVQERDSGPRNVGGAAGSIGVGRAVRSPADGYTLSIGTSTTHVLTGGLYKLPFNLLSDLDPVILIVNGEMGIEAEALGIPPQ